MATSTYQENVNAQQVDAWTTMSVQASAEYRGNPDNLDDNQSRAHNVVQRYRHLRAVAAYNSQEGQVGIGDDLRSYMAANAPISPGGSIGYICTDDILDLTNQGTDIMRQTQTWEHWGAWATYDVSDLAS